MTGEELRQWMTDNGWSVAKLAAAVGVSGSTIQGYRNGQPPPPERLVIYLDRLEEQNLSAYELPGFRHDRGIIRAQMRDEEAAVLLEAQRGAERVARPSCSRCGSRIGVGWSNGRMICDRCL